MASKDLLLASCHLILLPSSFFSFFFILLLVLPLLTLALFLNLREFILAVHTFLFSTRFTPWTPLSLFSNDILGKPHYPMINEILSHSLLVFSLFCLLSVLSESEIEVAQSCLTLCNPIDCSLPGSSVHGILQARIMEWVAISFSRDLPDPGIEPGLPHCRQTVYRLSYQGSP